MLSKIALLALGYVAATILFLAVAWQPTDPAASQKTDRLIGAATQTPFLMERFAG